MPWKEALEKIDVPPKTSLIVTVMALVFVLLNNYVYLKTIQDRDQKLTEEMIRIQTREDAMIKRERVLRLWEMELLQKEKDVSEMIRKLSPDKTSPKAETRG